MILKSFTYLSGLCEQHGGGDIELTVVKGFNNGNNIGGVNSSGSGIGKYCNKNMFLHIERTRIKRPRPTRPRKPEFLCRKRRRHEFPKRKSHDLSSHRGNPKLVRPETEELVHECKQYAREKSKKPCPEC